MGESRNPAIRLVERLRTLGVHIPEGSRAIRASGHHASRSPGMWSWHIVDAEGKDLNIGSVSSMREINYASYVDVTQDENGRTVVAPVSDPSSTTYQETLTPKYKLARLQGEQILEILINDAPDITPEQSAIVITFRPHFAELRYQREDAGTWTLTDIRVTGRPVHKATGGVIFSSRKVHYVTYRDLTGKGGIHRAKTPAWVVAMAVEYATPPTGTITG